MGGPKETEHGRGGRHWKTGRRYKGRRCKWMQVANALSESYLDWLTSNRQRTLKRKRQETARKRGGRRDWENGRGDQETDRGSSLLYCSDTCDFFEPSIFLALERNLFHLFMSKLCCKMRCDFAALWLTPPFVFTSHSFQSADSYNAQPFCMAASSFQLLAAFFKLQSLFSSFCLLNPN